MNENWPRKNRLWISPIRSRNTTAPKPVITPTISASSESGKRRKRRTESSIGAGEADGALVDVSTTGALSGPGDGVSSGISAHLWMRHQMRAPNTFSEAELRHSIQAGAIRRCTTGFLRGKG